MQKMRMKDILTYHGVEVLSLEIWIIALYNIHIGVVALYVKMDMLFNIKPQVILLA